MAYEEFFEKQLVSELEQRAIERHQELFINNYSVDKEEVFIPRFNAILDSEKQGFKLSLNDYKTKLQSLGDDTFILYNPGEGVYGYVKHILFGLDTDLNKGLKRELDILKTREMTRDTYLKERKKILDKTIIKDLREGLNTTDHKGDGRFPGYPDFSEQEYSFNGYKGLPDFYSKFKSDFGALNEDSDMYQYDSAKFADKKAMLDEFKKYIFIYNTDPGMFNNKVDYLLPELGSMNTGETYMAEFAETSRELIAKGEGFYKLTATDYGYHLIICSDIIKAGEEDLAGYDTIVSRIVAGTETSDDKASAIYKLYMLIRNELGQTAYSDSSGDTINNYYKENKVEFFKSRYKDLIKV